MSRGVGLAAVVALLAGTAACSTSSSDNGKSPLPTTGTTPPPSGAVCDDPTGDLITGASGRETVASGPAGIDIVHAEAKLTPKTLQVTIRTAGPINAVASPTFIVGNGTVPSDVGFELRAEPNGPAPSPPWAVSLITFKSGNEKAPKPLSAPVTVTDDVITYEVQLSDIPPIVSTLWNFGAVTGDGDTAVTDECNNISGTSQTPGGTLGTTIPVGPTRSSAPNTTVPPIAFGTEQTYVTTGSKITVYDAQFPPKQNKALPIPPDPGFKPAVVDAQVCAGGAQTETRTTYFQIKTQDNRLYPIWGQPQSAADPAFPQSQVLQPGECIRGWVTFQLPEDAQVAAVYYSPDTSGRNYLVWKVS